ncbi:hypothetical protein [Thermococcus stetteri]|uniref:hypothetical protein n=1 Tax=Thermococcus stetteri TaxID=49900 RepID=UPI001AE5B582|nr:hypothetical protein [Thermococcus stetteri]MBP1911333.1 putative membrane protein [Thermococcus stetteri]
MIDHNTLGYLTFTFMTLSMLSGAMILVGKRKRVWINLHAVLSVITYLLMFATIWLVR